ncbi:GNAT family acetyltransferase Nat4 [Phyllosticta citriasiana]|uniref:GNAT family acetyltransferase Nat4 n=1 Tax=Phyllosticta citriasiana TaxID=595635 RepID=UPI0030FD71EF
MSVPNLKRKAKQPEENEEVIEKINSLSPTEFHDRFFGTSSLLCFRDYDLTLKAIRNMSKADLTSCFDLIGNTSLEDYETSERGWNPKQKLAEMQEDNMQYLLVRKRMNDSNPSDDHLKTSSEDSKTECHRQFHEDNELAGFVSFMFTIEDDYPVVYIYEIHLGDSHRGCGLGRHLMNTVERCAKEGMVDKVMLTCFRKNSTALAFYTKLGFGEDEFSPTPKRLRGGKIKYPSYMIMSKSLRASLSQRACRTLPGRAAP